jgi:hypothetical protein
MWINRPKVGRFRLFTATVPGKIASAQTENASPAPEKRPPTRR